MTASMTISSVAIRREQDVLLARQRTRQISQFLGFSTGDTTRITTALSEVARNAFEYGGGGTVAFSVESQAMNRQDLVIRVTDEGPGIGDVDAVMSPDFKSRTGMGIGIRGSRALMDRFVITSTVGRGTIVVMAKSLPWSTAKFGAAEAARLSGELAKASEATPFGELQAQNQALLIALQDLTQRQAEIDRLRVIADEARDRSEAAQRVAERSLVVRERFMALTTHEFRTPLNAILGYLDLLDMEIAASITDKQKGYFSRVQRACKHLIGVTNDFLDMAQGEAGRLKVEHEKCAAHVVMAEALALVAPQAAARNVTVNLSQTTEHCMYFGDADRVRQVLVNVLGNAVSFTPPGGAVDVIASRVMEAPPSVGLTGGPWCAIRVEDSGPGIPEDKLQHVFEPFVQLSTDGQSTRKGSGLGLTVSKQLAVLMHGDLTVESTGKGAIFTLWLAEGPIADATASEPIELATADAVT
ncbi:MAG TPA: sensor histidine kinase [Gemmatimonadaceae bacterium]|nr:sensor histidine kinase [Gemmatimonadaceae bacterium]